MSQCLKNLKPIQRFNFGAVCVFAFLSTLLFSLSFASSASALSLGDSTGNYNITSSRVEEHGGQFVNGYRVIDGVQNGYESTFFMISDTAGLNYDLQNLEVQIDRQIPKNSLVTFNFSIKTRNVGFNYYGISFKNATTIHDSCVGPYSGTGIAVGSTSSYNTTSVGCTITLLTNNDKISFTAIQDARIAWVYNNSYTMGAGVQPEVEFSISPGSWHQLTNDGLSASDRAWLEDVIGDSSDSSAVIAKLQEIKTEQQATTNAVRAQTQQQHDDYENEVEREEAKEEELNEQKDDLNLSAQATANPFANLFNFSGCVNMPTVGGWFNNPNLRVCSPYPSTISGILNFVGSAVICGFLIRIYYKHMQGGFNG